MNQCLEFIQPQLSLFLGLQNFERTINLIESLESFPHLEGNQNVEETLDNVQFNLLNSLAEDAGILGKRRLYYEDTNSKKSKKEQAESEDEGLLMFFSTKLQLQ